jgi:hypothetical protein
MLRSFLIVLMFAPFIMNAQSAFDFDMHHSNSEKAAPNYHDNFKLTQGVVYVLTVSGTFSIYEAKEWGKNCGNAETKPLTASKGITNASVGFDPQFTFAQPISKCGKLTVPFRDSYFEISLDGGLHWQIPESNNSYNPEHIYVFELIGDNHPIQIRPRLSDNSSSYGLLNFTLIRKTNGAKSNVKLKRDIVIRKEIAPIRFTDKNENEAVEDAVGEDTPTLEFDSEAAFLVPDMVSNTDGAPDGVISAGIITDEDEVKVSENAFTPTPKPFNTALEGDSLIMPPPFHSTAIRYAETFNVENKFVFIEIWDNSQEDGDTVSLFLNGNRILADALLSHKKRVLKIELGEGDNSIVMYAHNLGTIGKNTASIKITDKTKVYHRHLESDLQTSEAIKILSELKN